MPTNRTFAPVTMPDGTVVYPKTVKESIDARFRAADMRKKAAGEEVKTRKKTGAVDPMDPDKTIKAPTTDFEEEFGLKGVISTEDPRSKSLFNALPDYDPPKGEGVTREQKLAYDLNYTKQSLAASQAQTQNVIKTTGTELERQQTASIESESARKGQILSSKRKLNPAFSNMSEEERKANTQVFDTKLNKFVPRDQPLVPKYIEETGPSIQQKGLVAKPGKITPGARSTTLQEQEDKIEKGIIDRQEKAGEIRARQATRRGEINPDIKRELAETAQSQKQAGELRKTLENARPANVGIQEWNLMSDAEKALRIRSEEQIQQNKADYDQLRQDVIDQFTPDPSTGKLAPQDQNALNKRLKTLDDKREQQLAQEKNAMLASDINVQDRLTGEFGVEASKNALRNKQTALFTEDDEFFESEIETKKKIALSEAESETEEFVSEGGKTEFMSRFEEEWAKQEEKLRAEHASSQASKKNDLEVSIANNKELKSLEKNLTSGNDLKKLQAREKQAYVMDFMSSDTGDPTTSVGRAMSAYNNSIKFGGTPKDAQTFEEIDELVSEKQLAAEQGGEEFNRDEIFELSMTKLGNNVTKGRTYMKSRGYLASDIEEQVGEFQKNVLGYTEEEIAGKKKKSRVEESAAKAYKGEELSDDELDDVAIYEAEHPKEARRIELKMTTDLSNAEIWKLTDKEFEKPKKAKVAKKEKDLSPAGKIYLEDNPEYDIEDLNEDDTAYGLSTSDKTILSQRILSTREEDAANIEKAKVSIDRVAGGGAFVDGVFRTEDELVKIEGVVGPKRNTRTRTSALEKLKAIQ